MSVIDYLLAGWPRVLGITVLIVAAGVCVWRAGRSTGAVGGAACNLVALLSGASALVMIVSIGSPPL